MAKNIVKTSVVFAVLLLGLLFFLLCTSRSRRTNFVIISRNDTMDQIISKAANVVPSPRQFSWQQMELSAFIHFGINTFYDQEWGDGKEDPARFNPTAFDARQWAGVCKGAGMRQIILTAKHHDGFCLWQTEYTEHSVKNSPWKNGRGDVVREVADACREYGLKFGVYLSPWDRHEPSYGDSRRYNEYFKNQLRELLTNYGEISEVWFDGASGEGPNGKRQVYDWQGYYQLIRKLQPHAVIAIMGPDVRWVGTESGYGRETEWSVIPIDLSGIEVDTSRQDFLDSVFIPRDRTQQNLGSRSKLKKAGALIWYPSEVDVSIRPGWFYHQNQDSLVKSAEELLDIYFNSVGRNSSLLLNLPPDQRGLIPEPDVRTLKIWSAVLDSTFSTNLLQRARVRTSSEASGHRAKKTLDGNQKTYWTPESGVERAVVEYSLKRKFTPELLLLQEDIRQGQRVEEFTIEAWMGRNWEEIARGTTIGYKRMVMLPSIRTRSIRVIIRQSRTNPTLTEVGLYQIPWEYLYDLTDADH